MFARFALLTLLALAGVFNPVLAQSRPPIDTDSTQTAAPSAQTDPGEWYDFEVPGGRTTLITLGVDPNRERGAIMIDLIRRLHLSDKDAPQLRATVQRLAQRLRTESVAGVAVTLPLPLPPQIWSSVILQRSVSSRHLFIEVLNDPAARLIFHGLAALDRETRHWIAGQPELLRHLYRTEQAARSFALFAWALRVRDGKVVVAGGASGEARWTKLLGAPLERPDRFFRTLLDDRRGRTAGLYATVAAAEERRQKWILMAAGGNEAASQFERLADGFAACYPVDSTLYPFALRSHDAALLLLEVGVTDDGRVAGPPWRRFWDAVIAAESGPIDAEQQLRDVRGGGSVDVAWMVERLCSAPAVERASRFVTFLAGNRVFAGIPEPELPAALIALRSRRLYPAVFMALEHAGIERPQTYALMARHAARVARLEDRERAVTALRLFQGTLALVLNATSAGTFTRANAETLLESLAQVPFEQERYDGRMADWLTEQFLPAVPHAPAPRDSAPVETAIAAALAGPADPTPRHVRWEGDDYVLDFPEAMRRRLREVRKRQGGVSVDQALELRRGKRTDLKALQPALEYGGDGPDVAQFASTPLRASDFVLAHALGSWAYAPHVGPADSRALIAGDGSLRHSLGVTAEGRARFEQRWELALPSVDPSTIRGSFLGLQAAMADRSLRRLAADTLPPRPVIGTNDVVTSMLTVALSQPRLLTDQDMQRIVTAVERGGAAIDDARTDEDRLTMLAGRAAMSPWRREVLRWMMAEEPDRVPSQFTIVDRARLGGLDLATVRPWGTASMVSGCLCLQTKPARIPELIVGRPMDGALGGHSPDLMFRIAVLLHEMKLPAPLAAPVLAYAMRDFIDHVKPLHDADVEAFARQAASLDRQTTEDYVSAIAAVGALRPAGPPR